MNNAKTVQTFYLEFFMETSVLGKYLIFDSLSPKKWFFVERLSKFLYVWAPAWLFETENFKNKRLC